MAEGMTTTLDLIIPDVWADAVAPTILGRAVMVGLATVDDQLVGQPGDEVIFPKWDYIGDADELTEGVAMDTTKLSMTDSRARIKEAGKAVELTDNATLSALGNPNAEAERQLGLAVARKIDRDLFLAAVAEHTNGGEDDPEPTSAPLKVGDGTKPLSWNLFTLAKAKFGDDYDPSEMAGMVVHSSQIQQLENDPNFLSVDKFGDGAVILRGQIGRIGQVPVVVSDRLTGTSGTNVRALLLKRGALALKYKRRPIVEKDRDVLKRTNIVTTNVHYATKRVDDRGVVVILSSNVLVEDDAA
jgi:N4-gp56 family major capsid protein